VNQKFPQYRQAFVLITSVLLILLFLLVRSWPQLVTWIEDHAHWLD